MSFESTKLNYINSELIGTWLFDLYLSRKFRNNFKTCFSLFFPVFVSNRKSALKPPKDGYGTGSMFLSNKNRTLITCLSKKILQIARELYSCSDT